MNIVLTDIANITPFIIPVCPPNFTVTTEGDNSEEDTVKGKISVAGHAKLRCASWESFFPVNKNYSFANRNSLSNGWKYVAFIESMRTLKLPVRIIATNNQLLPILNMLATIENFTYSVDTASDIVYSINLKETPELIYQFAIRDKEFFEKAKYYLKDFVQNTGKKEKLIRAGLYIAKQGYK